MAAYTLHKAFVKSDTFLIGCQIFFCSYLLESTHRLGKRKPSGTSQCTVIADGAYGKGLAVKNCLLFPHKDIVPQLTRSEIHGKGVGARTGAGAALDAGTHHVPDRGQRINDGFGYSCRNLFDFYFLRWVHGSPFFIDDFQSYAVPSSAESMTSNICWSKNPARVDALFGQTVAHDPHP